MSTNNKVLDSAFFDISNGGIFLSIEQDGEEEGSNYHLGASIRALGVGVTVQIPMHNQHLVGYLHHITGKLLKRMSIAEDKGYPVPHSGETHIVDGAESQYKFVGEFDTPEHSAGIRRVPVPNATGALPPPNMEWMVGKTVEYIHSVMHEAKETGRTPAEIAAD